MYRMSVLSVKTRAAIRIGRPVVKWRSRPSNALDNASQDNAEGFSLRHYYATPSAIPRLSACRYLDSQHQAHLAAVNETLKIAGIALIDLHFSDTGSEYLRSLILGLVESHRHSPPIEHSTTRGWFWDVRPKKKEAAHQARSESSLDFPWHTDCSYESQPPRFFALHVLHADRNGGGTLSALEASQIVRKLSPDARAALLKPEFKITVPPEFDKGVASITDRLLVEASNRTDFHIRFRADIIEPTTTHAERGLHELNRLLDPRAPSIINDARLDLTAQDMPDNTIILMDNSRWLHARTEVKDPCRHLRRIRWGSQEFAGGK